MAPTMKRETRDKLDDVLAAMQPGLVPVCKYVGNGAAVVLLADALVTLELDDRDPRCRNWIETERAVFADDDDELSRRMDFMGRVEWEVKQWMKADGDEDDERDYFGARRERIRLAYSAMLDSLKGSMRPLGATPTVSVAEAAGF